MGSYHLAVYFTLLRGYKLVCIQCFPHFYTFVDCFLILAMDLTNLQVYMVFVNRRYGSTMCFL